jgi:hypothetical protein
MFLAAGRCFCIAQMSKRAQVPVDSTQSEADRHDVAVWVREPPLCFGACCACFRVACGAACASSADYQAAALCTAQATLNNILHMHMHALSNTCYNGGLRLKATST